MGVIGITNVFKPTKRAPGFLPRSELLAGAEEAIDNIVKTVPRSEDAEVIMAACIKDKGKNFADQLRDKAAMDARWGPGNWVAIPTFDYIQASGKHRRIDNGLKSRHNEATQYTEDLDLCVATQPVVHAKLIVAEAERQGKAIVLRELMLESAGEECPDACCHDPIHSRISR